MTITNKTNLSLEDKHFPAGSYKYKPQFLEILFLLLSFNKNWSNEHNY